MLKKGLLRILLCLIFAGFTGALLAQDTADTIPYHWYSGDLWLSYPAMWEPPLESSQPSRLILTLKPVFDDEQDPYFNGPDTPVVTVVRLFDAGSTQADLRLYLTAALQDEGLVTTEFEPIALMIYDGLQVQGTSLEGQRFGVGQAVTLDKDVLLVLGVGPAQAQAQITQVIADLFAESAELMGLTDESFVDSVADDLHYGVVWHSANFSADGQSLIDLSALALGPEGQLYSFERYRGLAQFDMLTGAQTGFFPNEDILDTFSLAVDAAGRVYVADPLCMCVMVKAADADSWVTRLDDVFHAGSPVYIALGPNDTLYATNHSPHGEVSIYSLQGEQVLNSYSLPESVTDQPLLAVHDGTLYALTNENRMLVLENNALNLLFSLESVTQAAVTDFAPLGDGLFAVVTASEGVLVVSDVGEVVARVGRLVPGFPLPGEFVWPTGIMLGPDGTLYIVDSDGRSATLTAFSTSAPPDRVGDEHLQLNQPVQGALDRVASQQTWTYEGRAGQEITLSAVDLGSVSAVDVALRLLGPDGTTLAENDNHTGTTLFGLNDAQITDFTLPVDGHYIIVVEHRSGEGAYGLGITETQPFSLVPEGVILEGRLSDSIPAQRWALDAAAGQLLTLTLTAQTESLDPFLRVIGPDGAVVAENDNAEDSTLGLNAQLVEISLPETGRYIIEASRFDGSGAYTLSVLPVSAP